MQNQKWSFVALLALVVAYPAAASVVWRGDFETGNRSQFSGTEMMAPDRLQVVPSPLRQGDYALRVEVRDGDDPINASGYRAELVKHDSSSEGKEYYYGWSTLFPDDYPMAAAWQVFMQWHHPGSNGAPPVRFVLGCSAADCGTPLPDTLFFIVDGKTVWTKAPVTRGSWHDFVLHIKWSANSSVGFVELWYDGQLVLPKRFVRTLYSSGDTNYLKMGLYRDTSIKPTGVMYHDALVQATTFDEANPAAVAPPPPPPPPPPPADAGSTGTPLPTDPTGTPPAGTTLEQLPSNGGEPPAANLTAGSPGDDPRPGVGGGCSSTSALLMLGASVLSMALWTRRARVRASVRARRG